VLVSLSNDEPRKRLPSDISGTKHHRCCPNKPFLTRSFMCLWDSTVALLATLGQEFVGFKHPFSASSDIEESYIDHRQIHKVID
jgi:hypothetical protein